MYPDLAFLESWGVGAGSRKDIRGKNGNNLPNFSGPQFPHLYSGALHVLGFPGSASNAMGIPFNQGLAPSPLAAENSP